MNPCGIMSDSKILLFPFNPLCVPKMNLKNWKNKEWTPNVIKIILTIFRKKEFLFIFIYFTVNVIFGFCCSHKFNVKLNWFQLLLDCEDCFIALGIKVFQSSSPLSIKSLCFWSQLSRPPGFAIRGLRISGIEFR